MNADINNNVASRLTVLYFIGLFFDEVPRKWIEKEKKIKCSKDNENIYMYTYFGGFDSEKHRN